MCMRVAASVTAVSLSIGLYQTGKTEHAYAKPNTQRGTCYVLILVSYPGIMVSINKHDWTKQIILNHCH